MSYVYPFRQEDIAKYGIKWIRGYTSTHRGIDWGMITGTPIIAVEDGKVTGLPYDAKSGYYISFTDINGRQSLYLHLSKRIIAVGQSVKKGTVIGYSGATGTVTGPHLHLSILNKPNYLETRFDFETLKPTYFNSNPLPPMATIPDTAYKSAKIGFDDLFAFFRVHGIRGDLDTYVKQGGDSVQWALLHGAKNNEFRAMYDSLVKERNALKAELANLNSPTNIVKALDRLNETIKNKP